MSAPAIVQTLLPFEVSSILKTSKEKKDFLKLQWIALIICFFFTFFHLYFKENAANTSNAACICCILWDIMVLPDKYAFSFRFTVASKWNNFIFGVFTLIISKIFLKLLPRKSLESSPQSVPKQFHFQTTENLVYNQNFQCESRLIMQQSTIS